MGMKPRKRPTPLTLLTPLWPVARKSSIAYGRSRHIRVSTRSGVDVAFLHAWESAARMFSNTRVRLELVTAEHEVDLRDDQRSKERVYEFAVWGCDPKRQP